MPRDKKKNDEEQGGAPGWMVTYGDLMSLLLTFFVLLLSFSTISEEEFNAAATSLQNALGMLPRNLTVLPMENLNRATMTPRSIQRVARLLRERLQELGQEKDIDVEYDKQGGLKINLPSQILFESGAANIKPNASPVLKNVAELLAGVPGAYFEVRGHTDSRPLGHSATYRDNYDLSFARADSVARYLQSAGPIPMDQFEIIACGPGQPVATNDTPEGRQKNRRVEIYVRGKFSEDELQKFHDKLREEAAPSPVSDAAGAETNEVSNPWQKNPL